MDAILLLGKLKKLSQQVATIPAPLTYKGSVATQADLPTSATKGDYYNISSTGQQFVYNGSAWTAIGLSTTITNAQIDALFI